MAWNKVKKFFLARREKETHPAINYLRNIGGGLSVLGLVGIFQFPQFFPYSVGALYAGLTLLAIEAWFENWGRLWRLLVSMAWVGVALVLTAVFVRASLPLEIHAESYTAEYPLDTKVAGINWSTEFTELHVTLYNPTKYDYGNVSVVIRPDQPVAAIAELGEFHKATFEDAYSVDTRPYAENLQNGERRNIPLMLVATSGGYRVRIEKLSHHDHAIFVMALVAILPRTGSPFDPRTLYGLLDIHLDGTQHWYGRSLGDGYFGAKPDTKSVNVIGEYEALLRIKGLSVDSPVTAMDPLLPLAK